MRMTKSRWYSRVFKVLLLSGPKYWTTAIWGENWRGTWAKFLLLKGHGSPRLISFASFVKLLSRFPWPAPAPTSWSHPRSRRHFWKSCPSWACATISARHPRTAGTCTCRSASRPPESSPAWSACNDMESAIATSRTSASSPPTSTSTKASWAKKKPIRLDKDFPRKAR